MPSNSTALRCSVPTACSDGLLHLDGSLHESVGGLQALFFQAGKLSLAACLESFEVGIALGLDGGEHVCPLLLATGGCLLHLLAQVLESALLGGLVHLRDDVLGEVEHALQVAGRDVQQQAETAGRALHEPDVRHGRGKLDVAHALAAHLAARDFDAALVADDALVADALVLTAVALEVLLRSEDLLAEEAVFFGLERAVVDCFRLCHLSIRPGPYLLWRCQRDTDGVEVVDLK